MKQIYSFLTMMLLMFLSLGNVAAQGYDGDVTTITPSPADGSNDVWYHIVLPVRTYGIWGNSGMSNSSYAARGFYYDQGRGRLLMNVEDTLDVPGTRWKFVETATEGQYRLISGLGNTLDCSPKSEDIGKEGQPGYIPMDRIYTTAPGTQYVTISTRTAPDATTAIAGLKLSRPNNTSGGGVDKTGADLYFDGNYGPDTYGGAVLFRPVSGPLEGMYLVSSEDLDLGDTPVGKTKTRTLTVDVINKSGDLSYKVLGDGFSVATGETTADGGTAKITFAPTEQKAYTAELAIIIGNQSDTIILTGNADFEFPIVTGDGNWYYIQFDRQKVNNKVLQANGLVDDVTQALIDGGKDNQLWKITGDWDEYHIVSKDGTELSYNMTSNKYGMDDEEYGNEFGLERFSDTDDWQIRNMSAGYLDDEGESPTRRYLNDHDTKGDSVTNYNVNDAGNRLIFIPATTQSLVVGLESIDFGSAPTGVGATVKKTVPVGGLNTTGVITAEIKGTGKDAFALTATTVPATGGTFEVTFLPLAIDNYKAELILSSPGVENDTVQLKARGSVFPFKLSEGSNEHWYYIQFMRRKGKAWTNNGTGEEVTQTLWTEGQPENDAQIWKITGSWDNFVFVSKTGGELLSIPAPTADEPTAYGFYKIVAAGSGGKHIAEERTTGSNTGWGFQSVEAKAAGYTKYINDNEGERLGLYGYNDDGGPVNFVSITGTSIIPDYTTLSYGDVTIGLKGDRILTVSTRQTTADITYTLGGAGAGVFKITNTTAGAAAADPLPAAGGTLKISFEPETTGEYVATLTLSSTGADDVTIVLIGNAVPHPGDFPVKISDETSTTWYTVYFKRRYTSGYSWKVWTAGLIGETIKQTTHTGRENAELTSEEQLWKFVVAPSKNGYLAVSYSGLAAKNGGGADEQYTLEEADESSPLIFKKNTGGAWVMFRHDGTYALNDQSGSTICEYSSTGDDSGCPLLFSETTPPDPVRIQISSSSADLGNIEPGAPALYSNNVIVKGYRLTENIAVSLSGEGASAYTIVRSADSTAVSTLPAAGDTLKIVLNPAQKQAYNATLTFSSGGASSRTIELKGGGDLTLPAKPSTASEPVWYYIGFVRQSPQYDPPKTYTRVFTADNDTLRQVDKAEVEQDAQLWRIEGTAAQGYQLVNKNGTKAVYDSTSTVRAYLLHAEGDRFSFVSGTGDNANKVQLRNLTNMANSGYLCDKDNKGFYAVNYSRNDAGNWLFFIPQKGEAIVPVNAELNDPVTSSAYYNLQGIPVRQPVRGAIHIRVDRHASGKTTATKFLHVK